MADGGGGYGGTGSVAPGWYRDPAGAMRWWDGQRWGQAAPPPPGYAPPGYALPGYARRPNTTVALFAHLSCVLGGFIVAIVLYAVTDANDRWTKSHCAEAANIQLTILCLIFPLITLSLVLAVAVAPAFFFLYLLFFLPQVVTTIWGIRAAIRASRGGTWRYPLRFGFFKSDF